MVAREETLNQGHLRRDTTEGMLNSRQRERERHLRYGTLGGILTERREEILRRMLEEGH